MQRRRTSIVPRVCMIALTLAFPPRGPGHSGAATAEEQAAHAEEQRAPADPRAILQAMADPLDQQPDFVVLKLEGLAITQRDTADIIRGMPLGMAWLSFQDVY